MFPSKYTAEQYNLNGFDVNTIHLMFNRIEYNIIYMRLAEFITQVQHFFCRAIALGAIKQMSSTYIP